MWWLRKATDLKWIRITEEDYEWEIQYLGLSHAKSRRLHTFKLPFAKCKLLEEKELKVSRIPYVGQKNLLGFVARESVLQKQKDRRSNDNVFNLVLFNCLTILSHESDWAWESRKAILLPSL